MHSLSELNNFSSEPVVFGDERPFAYTITPNVSSTTASVFGSEGENVTSPCPFSITSLQSANSSVTSFTVNVKAYSGATVSWSSVPSGVTITNPTTGIYRASGWDTLSEFNAIKNPSIYFGADRSGNLTYSANLTVSSGITHSWTVSAVLSDSAEINTSSLPTIYYDEYISLYFNSGLVVTDTNPSGTYSISISKSDNSAGNLTSIGSGGSSVYSANVLTISGNKSQVNSRLGNIQFNPAPGYNQNLTLNYLVFNESSAVTSTATQSLIIGNTFDEVTDIYRDRNYISNITNNIFANNTPYLSEITPSSDTYSIFLQLSSNIGYFALTNDYIGKTGWDTGTLTYSFSGNLAQCNTTFENLRFYPNKDTITNNEVTYTQRRNGIFQLSETFSLLGNTNPNPIAGSGLVTYATPGTYEFSPTFEQYYYLGCDVLLVGAGGITPANATISYDYNSDADYDLLYSVRNGTIFQKRAAEANVSPAISSTYTQIAGGGGAGTYNIVTNVSLGASNSITVPNVGSGPARFKTQLAAGGNNGTLSAGGTSGSGLIGGSASAVYRVRPQFTYQNSFGGFQFIKGIISDGARGGGGGGYASVGSNATTSVNGAGGTGVTVSFGGSSYTISNGSPGGGQAPGNYGSGDTQGLVVLRFYA